MVTIKKSSLLWTRKKTEIRSLGFVPKECHLIYKTKCPKPLNILLNCQVEIDF